MLHGLWSQGAGLMLWRDHVDDRVPAGPLLHLVQRSAFRHRISVLRPGADGPATAEVRAMAIAPSGAATVLLGTRTNEGLSGDLRYLRYLRHVTQGIERWAQAGRVVPEVYRAEGEWWIRWRLVGGERQRAWLAERSVAMPPALRNQGPASRILADFVTELTDPIVRSRISSDFDANNPLVESLVTEHRPRKAHHNWRLCSSSGESPSPSTSPS